MLLRPRLDSDDAPTLTLRCVRADELPRGFSAAALQSASAKTPGGIAPAPPATEAGTGTAGGGSATFYLGLGEADVAACYQAGRKAARALHELTGDAAEGSPGPRVVAVELGALAADRQGAVALARGLHVGTYALARWRREPERAGLADVTVLLAHASPASPGADRPGGSPDGGPGGAVDLPEVLAEALALATGQLAAMHLVDRPANAKRPADVAAYVSDLGAEHGFGVEVLDEEALEIQGFTGILAVGRASAHPPRLLKLHYAGGDAFKLGLVGKGITFDTGGVSIKGSQNMGYMKSDLGGAAAVLGCFIAVARLGLPVELHGLLPVAENAVGADAYLPSDVVRNYSGATIEIVDTDAEGRIVMADALAYLPEWAGEPALTIDVATLTGSAVRTFGYECAAMFSHDADVLEALREAGEQHHERVWPLPLWASYEADLKSDVADVKHFHGKPIAGAINAAKFLEYFAHDKQRWAHLDIAGVAFGASEFSKDRAATGYGVALLTQFLANQCPRPRP